MVLQAYVGFHCPEFQPGERLAGVASGNWGCGVYRGDARLKSLLQLMAASEAGRHLAYFTFGDADLRDQVYHMYTFLTDKQVTVGKHFIHTLIWTPHTLHWHFPNLFGHRVNIFGTRFMVPHLSKKNCSNVFHFTK